MSHQSNHDAVPEGVFPSVAMAHDLAPRIAKRAALALTCALALAACDTDTGAGLDSMIDACTPVTADGPSIREVMVADDWSPQSPSANPAALRDLISSQMWTLMPDATPSAQNDAIDEMALAFQASLNDPDFGQMYVREGAVAVILSQGDNLSCLWAGPEAADFVARAEAAGGFPDVADMSFLSVGTNDIVTENDRSWRRNTDFAKLGDNGAFGTYPAAARLDRSPNE